MAATAALASSSPLQQVFSSQTAARYVAEAAQNTPMAFDSNDFADQSSVAGDDEFYLPSDLPNADMELAPTDADVSNQQDNRSAFDQASAQSSQVPLPSGPAAASVPQSFAAVPPAPVDPQLLVMTQLVATLQMMQQQSAAMLQQSAAQNVQILAALQALDPSRRTARQSNRRHPDAHLLASNLRQFLTNQGAQCQGQGVPPIVPAAQSVFGMSPPGRNQSRQPPAQNSQQLEAFEEAGNDFQ
jgi:hypothetical protein